MADSSATYVFATCHAGLETWLKADVQQLNSDWRVAFSRPGFVTWRAAAPLTLPWRKPLSMFAHAFAVCWGKANSVEEIVHWGAQLSAQHRRLRLHVWARTGNCVDADAVPAMAATLRAALPHAFLDDGPAQPGDGVLTVIAVDPHAWWAGWYVQTHAHAPWAGGHWPVVVPSDAPSRAYTKLATTLSWARLPLTAGDNAVELGAAPGGAAYALLEHNVNVWGIDPAAMDPKVAALAKKRARTFVHLNKAAGEVRPKELPASVQWVVSDMNLAAPVAWRYVKRLLPWFKNDLRGLILTLKLNDVAALQKLPHLLDDIKGTAHLRDICVAQLPPYRREVIVVGRTHQAGA